jgi:IPTL-CTERM motif
VIPTLQPAGVAALALLIALAGVTRCLHGRNLIRGTPGDGESHARPLAAAMSC